jgi:DNA transposition AAA+ family ATPase
MTDHQKKEIQMLLKLYVEQYPSQAKASTSLRNVSESTIINIRTGKWENISDDMWRNVGKQVGFSKKGTWNFVETVDAKMLIHYFEDAKEFSNVFAITAPSGSGKTYVSQWYEGKRHNVYHISCAEYFNRKVFLTKILEKMGKENTGYNVAEMMDLIVDLLMRQENPLIILDEVDKLPDPVLYFFITLYNHLHGKCGIVMLATDFFAKRIVRGRRINKKGYSEIYSRLGRRFISLRGTDKDEVAEICKANGLKDPSLITSIYNEYEGDLRRLERGVHKSRMRTMKKAA